MSQQALGKDNLLYISSHGLSLYVQEGGRLEVESTPAGLQITMFDVLPDDPALHQAFINLISQDDANENRKSENYHPCLRCKDFGLVKAKCMHH